MARSFPAFAYQSDPIRRSLDLLGRKWTLLLLRDLAFLNIDRFGDFVRNNPGLTPRVLSRRLKEMRREGLVARDDVGGVIRYQLTSQGDDAVYILLAILRYGLKHHFEPGPPDARARVPALDLDRTR